MQTAQVDGAQVLDVGPHLGAPRDPRFVNEMARGLTGSEILKIAGEVRAMIAAGEDVLNLTVGDFDPKVFPIPEKLGRGIADALTRGETTYPPADGMPALREAIRQSWERELGLSYPLESVLVASGGRPLIYALYRSVVEAGDTVVFPTPNWNNNFYCHLMGAREVAVPTRAEDGFMPTAALLEPHLKGARLLALCTPLNPSGTMMTEAQLREVCDLVLRENARRSQTGERPLLVLFDQLYRLLTLGENRHLTPVHVAPEMAAYTIFVDGISKSYAATGLRVGWGIGPPSVIASMKDVVSHMGAWAPRPEQVATAAWLADAEGNAAYLKTMRADIAERLDLLFEGFQQMAADGLPVEAIAPQGSVFMSVRFNVPGRSTEDLRRLLLEKARVATIPFRAFGLADDAGWHRVSVCAAQVDALRAGLTRIRSVLASL